VKPESKTFTQEVPSLQNSNHTQVKPAVDTYAEWDTWETIIAIKESIEIYHDVTLIDADENAFQKLRKTKPDIVFNIAEGINGQSRESQIPAMLDMLQIPYTGSDALTLGICLNKARTKEILSYHNIPTPRFNVINNYTPIFNHSFEFPLIVKPISEGSSKGIFNSSLVNNYDELNREVKRVIDEYNQSALIEEYLPGREFTAAVIGNSEETKVLPIIEINYDKYPEDVEHLYSYEAKWLLDTKESDFDVFECPASLDSHLEKRVVDTALNTFKVLGCKDWSRVDIRMDKKEMPNVIEINPLPGIMPDPNENSSLPKAARAAGIDYKSLIQGVLYAACKRNGLL